MGEAAENKILSLLKQGKREEESEANKLLRLLRNRTKSSESSKVGIPVETKVVVEPQKEPSSLGVSEILSLPGLSTLHLFGSLGEDSLRRLGPILDKVEDGWLRYFLLVYPLMSLEVAGLPLLPVNLELKEYQQRLSLFLHKLLVQWRLRKTIFSEEISTKELDELLIRLLGKLKILVQQGRLQQVNFLKSEKKEFTLLCTLNPESFTAVSRFMKVNRGSLFAHLTFMVEIMAKEVITNRPGQLKEAIAVGESLEWLREKLLVLVHRLALRTHMDHANWEDTSRCANLAATLVNRLKALFARNEEDGLAIPVIVSEEAGDPSWASSRLVGVKDFKGGENGLF